MKMHIRNAALVAATLGAFGTSSNALAEIYGDFVVNPPGDSRPNFTADKIGGNYVEILTLGPVTDVTAPGTGSVGNGEFAVSILWNAGQFLRTEGVFNVGNTGLSSSAGTDTYGLYGIFNGTGVYSATSATNASFTVMSGNFSLYLDLGPNNTFAEPTAPLAAGETAFDYGVDPTTTPTTRWVTAGFGDDTLLATGTLLTGLGGFDCNTASCGSFEQITTFSRTAAGEAFFVAPVPFFTIALQSGHFNVFDATGPSQTLVLNGGLDAFFPVPEPTTLALFGAGLLALGFGIRKKKA